MGSCFWIDFFKFDFRWFQMKNALKTFGPRSIWNIAKDSNLSFKVSCFIPFFPIRAADVRPLINFKKVLFYMILFQKAFIPF